ncbi:MAG: motile sperm domain-containing protein, partial [archaeon]|nr:motile sperm domain-containing protein [archaeon]
MEQEFNEKNPMFNLDQNFLYFNLSEGNLKESSTCKVGVTNLTKNYILIVIKTTNLNDFNVVPNIFILDPLKAKETIITYDKKIKNRKSNSTSNKKDKFLFTGYVIQNYQPNSNCQEIYEKIKNDSKNEKNLKYLLRRDVCLGESVEKEKLQIKEEFGESLFKSFVSNPKEILLKSNNSTKGNIQIDKNNQTEINNWINEYNKLKEKYDKLEIDYEALKQKVSNESNINKEKKEQIKDEKKEQIKDDKWKERLIL